jgi:hypothetical protein
VTFLIPLGLALGFIALRRTDKTLVSPVQSPPIPEGPKFLGYAKKQLPSIETNQLPFPSAVDVVSVETVDPPTDMVIGVIELHKAVDVTPPELIPIPLPPPPPPPPVEPSPILYGTIYPNGGYSPWGHLEQWLYADGHQEGVRVTITGERIPVTFGPNGWHTVIYADGRVEHI